MEEIADKLWRKQAMHPLCEKLEYMNIQELLFEPFCVFD
jgi:hypothetical protein